MGFACTAQHFKLNTTMGKEGHGKHPGPYQTTACHAAPHPTPPLCLADLEFAGLVTLGDPMQVCRSHARIYVAVRIRT